MTPPEFPQNVFPLNTPPFDQWRDFSVATGKPDISGVSIMEMSVPKASNQFGADLFAIYTGIAIAPGVEGDSGEWRRGSVRISFPQTGGRRWTPPRPPGGEARGPGWTVGRHGTVVLSLAGIRNEHAANNAGWAIDNQGLGGNIPFPGPQGPEDMLYIEALVSVRDSDGALFGISYQVCLWGTVL